MSRQAEPSLELPPFPSTSPSALFVPFVSTFPRRSHPIRHLPGLEIMERSKLRTPLGNPRLHSDDDRLDPPPEQYRLHANMNAFSMNSQVSYGQDRPLSTFNAQSLYSNNAAFFQNSHSTQESMDVDDEYFS